MADRQIGSEWRRWRGEDDGTAVDRVGVLATVMGTDDDDFIHRAGDGLPKPSGYNNVTGVTTGGDTIDGRAGNDIIYGDAGDDRITGGTGVDQLNGGDGDDTFLVVEANEISGLSEILDGGIGLDTLVLNSSEPNPFFDITAASLSSIEAISAGFQSTSPIHIRLLASQLEGISSSIESTGNLDVEGPLRMDGSITTFACADIILSDKRDVFKLDSVTLGFSELRAGGGDDVIVLRVEFGGGTVLTVDGGAGNDRVALRGAFVADFDGGTGNDNIFGGHSDDVLSGGDDNDILHGGRRDDTLTGGSGSDLFAYDNLKDSVIRQMDTITDFSHAEGDRIDLSKIDADTTQGGNQAFRFVESGAFTGHAGELIQFADGNGHTIVQTDVNGDGSADFQLQLDGAPVLIAGDFLL